MYLSRIRVLPGPELFELFKTNNSENGYAVHQLLWNLFPNGGEKKRDFLFRENKESEFPCFYMVSKDEPVANSALSVECKEYKPVLKKGDRLHFSLVANPVIARKKEGKKHSEKHDVWMDAKKKAKDSGLQGGDLYKACEDATKEWLVNRSTNNGFSIKLEDFVIDGYLQHNLRKMRGGKEIRFSSIYFYGLLEVSDPEIFVEKALFKGIGPAKAFGCGLLLVKQI